MKHHTKDHGLRPVIPNTKRGYWANPTDFNITQNAINLLLILIVLWICGRVRFQPDIEFVIKKRFYTVQIFNLRFLVPLFMMVTGIIVDSLEYSRTATSLTILSIIFILFPLIFIPGYAIRSMHQSIGTIKQRFLHCCRPDRQLYVEAGHLQYKYYITA